MARETKDEIELSSGRVISGTGWGVGLDSYGEVVLGCDVQLEYEFSEERLTAAERKELADIMIRRWTEYARG